MRMQEGNLAKADTKKAMYPFSHTVVINFVFGVFAYKNKSPRS